MNSVQDLRQVWRRPFCLFQHGRRVRNSRRWRRLRGVSDSSTDQPLRHLKADERVDAPGYRFCPRHEICRLRYFNGRGQPAGARMGKEPRSHNVIKVAARRPRHARPGLDFGHDYPTRRNRNPRLYSYRRPGFGPLWLALNYLKTAANLKSSMLAMAKGSSVREVVEVVRSISGVNFKGS